MKDLLLDEPELVLKHRDLDVVVFVLLLKLTGEMWLKRVVLRLIVFEVTRMRLRGLFVAALCRECACRR